MRRPARARLLKIHLATAVVMVPTATLLVWANLHVSSDAHSLGEDAPPELDPVTRYFFFRGWPLSPWKFCLIHGLRFRPEGGTVHLVLVLDLVAAGSVLLAVALLCNWIIECLRRGEAKGDIPIARS
jgi:hypothetical protein